MRRVLERLGGIDKLSTGSALAAFPSRQAA